jgi:hypothetical protein
MNNVRKLGSVHRKLPCDPAIPRTIKYAVVVATEYPKDDDWSKALEMRYGCVITEGLYIHWLRAIAPAYLLNQYDFLPLCPWGEDDPEYGGACRWSPFRIPIPGNEPTKSKDEK